MQLNIGANKAYLSPIDMLFSVVVTKFFASLDRFLGKQDNVRFPTNKDSFTGAVGILFWRIVNVSSQSHDAACSIDAEIDNEQVLFNSLINVTWRN